jgi:integrase
MKLKPQDLSDCSRIKFYTDIEQVKIYRGIHVLEKKPEWKAPCDLTRFLLAAGFRIHEAVAILVENCFENYVHAHKTKTGVPRDVEISPEAIEWYQKFVQDARDEGRTLLFPAFRRTYKTKFRDVSEVPLSRFTAMRWWKSVIKACGVRVLTSHAARRTFASWEAERLGVFDLKDQLGHASINTTEKYYRGSIPGRRFSKEAPQFREEMRL